MQVNSNSSNDPPAAPGLEPGTVLSDFRVDRVIGRGARGIVYEATQVSLDRRVALKLIAADPELAERIRRLEWPEHRHVASMYAAGVCEQGQFVAMQLVPGSTLAALEETGELDARRRARSAPATSPRPWTPHTRRASFTAPSRRRTCS